MMQRREFMLTSAASCLSLGAAPLTAAFASPICTSDEVGKRLPKWKPGELELHFIYTGRGENCFYHFPDGTTVVNDTGDFFRPREIASIPWRPRSDLMGGELVGRYIRSLGVEKKIDYALLSHWHNDHGGDPTSMTRLTADGRKVCGLPLLGEMFDFGRFYDHQFDKAQQYEKGDPMMVEMIHDWVAAKKIPQEKFRVGARNQIRLMHDAAGAYRDLFSIQNVCANAVCWNGVGEAATDYGAIHSKAIGREEIRNQNTLSMGFTIQYGAFRFWTGGDVSGKLKDAEGKDINFEAIVGQQVGRVDVCKTNHHAFLDAMTKEFVEQVRAAFYVTCVWCPRHIQDCNMQWMSSRTLYPGERMVCPNFVPEWPKKTWPNAPWWRDVAPGGHVVVKVAPGGSTYKVYLLDSRDESLRVTHVWERKAGV